MSRLFQSWLLIPLTIATIIGSATPILAAPIVRRVSQSQAQGFVGNGTQVITWPGSGTNIDFTPTGETIQRAWIDDPSRIVVDFDGFLGRRGGASIVHLKRVTNLSFPNLPRTQSTLLTVVTQAANGRKTYLFEVIYGSSRPQYASLVITPDSQVTSGVNGLTIAGNRSANWNDVERGLQRAVAQKLLPANSPVLIRVQEFLAQVRSGVSMQQATEQTRVSLAVITKLAEMGHPLADRLNSQSPNFDTHNPL